MANLRPSQYITTFGPGALIETPHGPHILCSVDDVLKRIYSARIQMEDIAIRDIRLQRGLLEGDKIFKIPDGQGWDNFTYPALKFPTWNLCVQHQDFNVIHKGKDGCPECKTEDERRKSKSNKHAIRFMKACPNGHLDDVDWYSLIHSSNTGQSRNVRCNRQYFHWIGSGSSLSAIRIECRACSDRKELGEIYSYKLQCRGRRPEKANAPHENCATNQAVVVQRGSFQLRLPEVITSLTLPELSKAVHRLLQRREIQVIVSTLKEAEVFNETSFKKSLAKQLAEKQIPKQVMSQLEECSWNEIEEALRQIEILAVPKSRAEYLIQEHKSLMDVVETGFPPYPHDNERRPGEPISFQVDATSIRKDVKSPSGKLVFRVMPLERLKVVMVQVGYRRVDYSPNSPISPNRGAHPLNEDEHWVPGVEQYGEGVYIDLNPKVENQSNWYPEGPAAKKWETEIPPVSGMNDLVLWNALSVWWHSLSHRLINAMSIHSGYSSTAIRERIYLSKSENGQLRGGILLYTTQPGGDGTMGGLTSLVTSFENIFQLALNGIDRCSNDPLCEHAEIDKVSKLGAACYSCEMVSETSCEHYNGYLHRALLLENKP